MISYIFISEDGKEAKPLKWVQPKKPPGPLGPSLTQRGGDLVVPEVGGMEVLHDLASESGRVLRWKALGLLRSVCSLAGGFSLF